MKDAELLERADDLHNQARSIQSPLIPLPARKAIRAAADLVVELAKREAKRNAKGER